MDREPKRPWLNANANGSTSSSIGSASASGSGLGLGLGLGLGSGLSLGGLGGLGSGLFGGSKGDLGYGYGQKSTSDLGHGESGVRERERGKEKEKEKKERRMSERVDSGSGSAGMMPSLGVGSRRTSYAMSRTSRYLSSSLWVAIVVLTRLLCVVSCRVVSCRIASRPDKPLTPIPIPSSRDERDRPSLIGSRRTSGIMSRTFLLSSLLSPLRPLLRIFPDISLLPHRIAPRHDKPLPTSQPQPQTPPQPQPQTQTITPPDLDEKEKPRGLVGSARTSSAGHGYGHGHGVNGTSGGLGVVSRKSSSSSSLHYLCSGVLVFWCFGVLGSISLVACGMVWYGVVW